MFNQSAPTIRQRHAAKLHTGKADKKLRKLGYTHNQAHIIIEDARDMAKLRMETIMNKAQPTEMYAPIYETEGRTWINTSLMSYDLHECERKRKDCDARIPQWTKDNKFLRIAKVSI